MKTWQIMSEALPQMLKSALIYTVPLTIISFAIALFISIMIALVQYSDVPVAKQIARFYIWIMRGTPVLVQLFIVFYGLPKLGLVINAYVATVITFSLNEGAYMAETMRGALESVPKGQIEAGYCVGMTYWQIMRRIVLPQAFKVAFPGLSNSIVALLKETSLASTITLPEMFMETKRIASRNFEYLILYVEVALVYLAITTLITFAQRKLEKKFNKGY